MITNQSSEFQQRVTSESWAQFPHPAAPQSYHSVPSPHHKPDQANFSPRAQFGDYYTHSGFSQNQHSELMNWEQSQHNQNSNRFHPHNIKERQKHILSLSSLYAQQLNQPTPLQSPNQCDKCRFVGDSALQLSEHCNSAQVPFEQYSREQYNNSGLQIQNTNLKEGHGATSDILDLDFQKVVYQGKENEQPPPQQPPSTVYEDGLPRGQEVNIKTVTTMPWEKQKIYSNSQITGNVPLFKDQKMFAKQNSSRIAYTQNKLLGVYHHQTSFMPVEQKIYPGEQMSRLSNYSGPAASSDPNMKQPYRTYYSSAASQITSAQREDSTLSTLPTIGDKDANWKSNEARRPKTCKCTACNKWFTSSGHLKRHYNTMLHKNAVRSSGQPDPATLPISDPLHPSCDNQNRSQQQSVDSNTPPVTASNSSVPTEVDRIVAELALQSPYVSQNFDRSHRISTVQSKSPSTHISQGNLDNNFINNPLTNTKGIAKEHCNSAQVPFEQYSREQYNNSGLQIQNTNLKEGHGATSDILDLDFQKVVYQGKENEQPPPQQPPPTVYEDGLPRGQEVNIKTVTTMPWEKQKIYSNSQITGNVPLFKDQKMFVQSKSPYTHISQGNLDNNFINNPLTNTLLQHQVRSHPHNIGSLPSGIVDPSDNNHQGSEIVAISTSGKHPNRETSPFVSQNYPTKGLLSVSTNNVLTPNLTQSTPALTAQTLPPFSHLGANPYSQRSTDPMCPTVANLTHTPLFLNHCQQTMALNHPNELAPQVTDMAISILPIANPATFGDSTTEMIEFKEQETSNKPSGGILPSFEQIQRQSHSVVSNYITQPNMGGQVIADESITSYKIVDPVHSPLQYGNADLSTENVEYKYTFSPKKGKDNVIGYIAEQNKLCPYGYTVGGKTKCDKNMLGSDSSELQILNIEGITDFANKEYYETQMKSSTSPESAKAESYSNSSHALSPTVPSMPLVESNQMKKSTSAIVHKCYECDKVFNKSCYLTQHNKALHSGDKPFKCARCGKRFADDASYESHCNKHSDNKPFKCSECPKSFNHKSDLRRHMCLHSDCMPFSCEHCGKGFIRKDHMLKHFGTHKRR